MPGSSRHSTSPARSETSSSADQLGGDGQSLGARLRRGAQLASHGGGVLRRLASLGGGGHTYQNSRRESQSKSSRQQQQQQQSSVSASPIPSSSAGSSSNTSSLTTTAAAGTTFTPMGQRPLGPSVTTVRGSPSSESVESGEGGGGSGGAPNKWGDLPFYSLFSRSNADTIASKSNSSAAANKSGESATTSTITTSSATPGKGLTTEESQTSSRHSSGRGSAWSLSGGGGGGASGKRPNSMRRAESLPTGALPVSSALWRGPNNFLTKTTASELPRPRAFQSPPRAVVLEVAPTKADEERPQRSSPRATTSVKTLTQAAEAAVGSEKPEAALGTAPVEVIVDVMVQGSRMRDEEHDGDNDENNIEVPRMEVLDSFQSSIRGGETNNNGTVYVGRRGLSGAGLVASSDGGSSDPFGSGSVWKGEGREGGSSGPLGVGVNMRRTPPISEEVEALRRKIQSMGRTNRRLTKRIARRDKTVHLLKEKAQRYRERLSVHEAPSAEDIQADRRAKAREWQRSTTKSHGAVQENDSDLDGRSDSVRSRSPSSTPPPGLAHLSTFETNSTLDSTPQSIQSRGSRARTPVSSFSTSTAGGGGGAGAGTLIAPPLGRIRLSSPSPSVGSNGGGGSGVGMVGCVPGSLSRKGSRNRIPPVAPGLEPEEQAERDREERAASLARSAAARAAWVYEGDTEGFTSTSRSDHVPGLLDLDSSDAGGFSSFLGRAVGGPPASTKSSFTPTFRGTFGTEAAMSPLVLERRTNQTAPSTPSNQRKDGEGWADVSKSAEVGPSSTSAEKSRRSSGGSRRSTLDSAGPKLSIDHKKLFRPNLVVEFGEDSPAFRRKVEALDRNVEGLRGHLQQLVAVARKYCSSGFAFCEQGRELAGILMNLQGESWFTRLGALAPALVTLGEVLGAIHCYEEEILLQSLEQTFCDPMEDFVKREIKTIRKMKQEMTRSCEDHEHATARYLQLKRNAEEGTTQAKGAEVALAKKRFEMARFDLVHHLNQLETRKKHEVVDRTCSALLAFLKLFHQCRELVASSEPHMRELQHALKLSTEDLDQEDRMWNDKRARLEASLNEAIPPAVLARISFVPAPSPTLSSTMATTASTVASNFSATWGGPPSTSAAAPGASAGAGNGGSLSNISVPRSSPALHGRSTPSGGSYGQPAMSPAPGTGTGLGVAAGVGAGGGAPQSLSTPLRMAQKRAVSLAARLASGVAGAGGGGGVGGDKPHSHHKGGSSFGGLESFASGSVGGIALGDSSSGISGASPQQISTPSTFLHRKKIAGDDSSRRGVASGGGGGVGGTGDGAENSSFCPSPLPSVPTSTAGTGAKGGGIWRMGTGTGCSSDEEEEEEEDGDGGGRRRSDGSGISGNTLWSPRQERCIKGGYLWKRSTNVRKDWKRRYFFIQNGKLFYQRHETEVSPPVRVCDIKLCHVKSCLKESDLRFSFEIISPKQRTYLLQAEDEESHQSWVRVIKAEIEHLLSASQPAADDYQSDWQASPPGAIGVREGQATPLDFSLKKTQLNKLFQANPACVDCGARDPDWASINLGVMMCIECSGIHRSMGVHVSKVRSLTLDRWTNPLLELLEKAGNVNANEVWEAYKGDTTFVKIKPDADRPSREAFIRAKYEHRRFIEPPFVASPEATQLASRRLFMASTEGCMMDAMSSLAHGADVNWRNPEADGRTAAHEAAEGSRIAILELLANNGCHLDACSDTRDKPLSIATRANKGEGDAAVLSLLYSKLEGKQNQGGGGICVSNSDSGGASGSNATGWRSTQGSAASAATAAATAAMALQQNPSQQHQLFR